MKYYYWLSRALVADVFALKIVIDLIYSIYLLMKLFKTNNA